MIAVAATANQSRRFVSGDALSRCCIQHSLNLKIDSNMWSNSIVDTDSLWQHEWTSIHEAHAVTFKLSCV